MYTEWVASEYCFGYLAGFLSIMRKNEHKNWKIETEEKKCICEGLLRKLYRSSVLDLGLI